MGSLIVLAEVPRARIWNLQARMAESRIQGSIEGRTTSELWKRWMGCVRMECPLTGSDYIKLNLLIVDGMGVWGSLVIKRA